jgi:hypothetical protein
MTFALKSFIATGVDLCGPQPQRQTQKLIFGITASSADVDLDLGDLSGTFWTDALSDSKYGDLAAAVKDWVMRNYPNWAATSRVFVQEIFSRVHAATASGTAYAQALNSTTGLPEFTFDTSQGETSYTVVVEMEMVNGILINCISYNPEGV